MRDPSRIKRIALKISSVWEQYPDLRFFQLVNLLTDREDPFYLEDDELEETLDSLLP